jgi:hypothetical protein
MSKTDPAAGILAFGCTLDPSRPDPELPLQDPKFEERLRSKPPEREKLSQYIKLRYGLGGSEDALPAFQNSDLVELVSHAGKQAQFEARGLRSWTYRAGKTDSGYLVELNYLITTPEGTFPAVISVLSSEAQGRQWQVLIRAVDQGRLPTYLDQGPLGSKRQLNKSGENILSLRVSSRSFCQVWVHKLSKIAPGTPLGEMMREQAFLQTMPPADDIGPLQFLHHGSRALAAASATTSPAGGMGPLLVSLPPVTDPEACRWHFVPGFAAFGSGALVKSDDMLADETVKPIITEYVQAFFLAAPKWDITKVPPPEVAGDAFYLTGRWQTVAPTGDQRGEVVFLQPFTVEFRRGKNNYRGDGVIRVSSDHPPLFLAATQPNTNPMSAITVGNATRWQIKSIELTVGSVEAATDKAR